MPQQVSAATAPLGWLRRYGSALVDAGRAEVGAARRRVLGSAQHHGSEGHTVDADIQQRSARQLRREQPAGGIGLPPRRPRSALNDSAGMPDFACLATACAAPPMAGHEAGPHALHQQHAARRGRRPPWRAPRAALTASGFSHSTCLLGIEADAGRQTRVGDGEWPRRWHVHGRVGGQRRVAAMRAACAPYWAANASARAAAREPTATSRAPAASRSPAAKLWAMRPGPRMPQFTNPGVCTAGSLAASATASQASPDSGAQFTSRSGFRPSVNTLRPLFRPLRRQASRASGAAAQRDSWVLPAGATPGIVRLRDESAPRRS